LHRRHIGPGAVGRRRDKFAAPGQDRGEQGGGVAEGGGGARDAGEGREEGGASAPRARLQGGQAIARARSRRPSTPPPHGKSGSNAATAATTSSSRPACDSIRRRRGRDGVRVAFMVGRWAGEGRGVCGRGRQRRARASPPHTVAMSDSSDGASSGAPRKRPRNYVHKSAAAAADEVRKEGVGGRGRARAFRAAWWRG
jgi:hypothetical protein